MIQSKNKNYLHHIDGLRALAVLAVLLFHLGVSFVPGGYVGVDVFFVISGFLITGILKNELDASGTIDFKRFFIRRIRRLLPALMIVSLVTFLFAALVFSPNHLQRISGALASALMISSNVFFWLEADYFDTSTQLKPFLHTWSLSVEWQFYLVLPFVMFVLYKMSLRKLILPTLIVASLLSIYLNLKFGEGSITRVSLYFPFLADSLSDGKSTIFYLIFFRVFEFCIGGIILWIPALKQRLHFLYNIIFWVGLGFVLYSIFSFTEEILFPYWYGLLPCIGSALVIYSGAKASNNSILTNRLSIAIGQLSYSLYLIHWPVIVFWHYLGDTFKYQQQLAITLISFVLSVILYKYVEQPMRLKRYSENKFHWVAIWSSFVLMVLVSFHSYTHQGWEWRLGEPIVNLEKLENSTTFHKKYYGGAGYPYFGPVNTKKSPDIVILGDSHGRHYAEGLYKVIAEPNDLSMYIAAGTSCFHLPFFTRKTEGYNWDKKCPEALENGLAYIKSSSKPPVVIIAHSWVNQMMRADLLDKEGNRRNIDITPKEVLAGLERLKIKIGESQLIVIGIAPGAGSQLYDIFTRPRPILFSGFEPSNYLYRDLSPKLVELMEFNKRLKQFSDETNLYTFIDPFDYLCDDVRCRNVDDNKYLIYSDESHLSKYGSVFLVDKMSSAILKKIESR